MKWHTDKAAAKQYINIFQSELQFMAGDSAQWGAVETGGALFGLQTHAGRLVASYATGPGPEAIHDTAHFRQNIEYFFKIQKTMNEKFGLQFLGDWHAHHILGIPRPSEGDIGHIRSIATKNNIPHMTEIILTHEMGFHGHSRAHDEEMEKGQPSKTSATDVTEVARSSVERGRCSECQRNRIDRVDVHTFLYINAPLGHLIKVPLRVIPGVSPIRQVLSKSELLQISDRETPGSTFPFDKIRFQPLESSKEGERNTNDVPATLLQEFYELPEAVKEGSEILLKGDSILFKLPVHRERKIFLEYHLNAPYAIRAGIFQRTRHSEPIDLEALTRSDGPLTRISCIYQRLVNMRIPSIPTQASEHTIPRDVFNAQTKETIMPKIEQTWPTTNPSDNRLARRQGNVDRKPTQSPGPGREDSQS